MRSRTVPFSRSTVLNSGSSGSGAAMPAAAGAANRKGNRQADENLIKKWKCGRMVVPRCDLRFSVSTKDGLSDGSPGIDLHDLPLLPIAHDRLATVSDRDRLDGKACLLL